MSLSVDQSPVSETASINPGVAEIRPYEKDSTGRRVVPVNAERSKISFTALIERTAMPDEGREDDPVTHDALLFLRADLARNLLTWNGIIEALIGFVLHKRHLTMKRPKVGSVETIFGVQVAFIRRNQKIPQNWTVIKNWDTETHKSVAIVQRTSARYALQVIRRTMAEINEKYGVSLRLDFLWPEIDRSAYP